MPEYRTLTSLSQIAAAIEAGETIECKYHDDFRWSTKIHPRSIYNLDLYRYRVVLPPPKLIEKTMYMGFHTLGGNYHMDYILYDTQEQALKTNNGYISIQVFMKETP